MRGWEGNVGGRNQTPSEERGPYKATVVVEVEMQAGICVGEEGWIEWDAEHVVPCSSSVVVVEEVCGELGESEEGSYAVEVRSVLVETFSGHNSDLQRCHGYREREMSE